MGEVAAFSVRRVPPIGGMDAVAAFAGRKRIGHLTFGQYDRWCPIGEVHVDPDHRRQGVALSMIKEANRLCRRRYGFPLSSSGIVSEPLQALFESLVSEGRARWDDRAGWHGEYVLVDDQETRLSNPRPIPLDDATIREDAEGIVAKLHEWAEEEIALRKADGINVEWPLQAERVPILHYDMKTQAVTGTRRIEKIVVSVLVTERANSNRIVVGGDASTWTPKAGPLRPVVSGKPEGRITIRLNASLTPGGLVTATRSGWTSPAFGPILHLLRHELTHVGDWDADKREPSYIASSKGEVEDWASYYNDPMEARAFVREIVDDVTRYTSLHARSLRPVTLVTNAIETSPQYERMRPYLTPENEKKILQAAYRAVMDEREPAIERGRAMEAMQERMKGRRENPACDLNRYRGIDRDDDAGSPLHAWGAVHANRLGSYWTIPVDVPVVDLLSCFKPFATASRLKSVKAARLRGDRLPPIEIAVFSNGTGWIVDGNHRLADADRSGTRTIATRFTFVGD